MVSATATGQGPQRLQAGQPAGYWLFSPSVDLTVFLGSALVSLAALAVGYGAGVLHQDTPQWAWVPFILLIDVAHVYSTGFRVYFDRQELRRRPLLYSGVPVICFLVGMVLFRQSSQLFWRVLAYVAVFHFVRQQYGWLVLYRAKRRESIKWEKYVDVVTIYAATIYPLIYWHGHLPRNYVWFLSTDFQQLPRLIADVFTPVYWLVMGTYLVKTMRCWQQGRGNPGKDIVVATTAVCWYVGIVLFNSDYAFTVTNVVIHGVPYMALVYWYMKARRRETGESGVAGEESSRQDRRWNRWSCLILLLSTVWLLAYLEELIWDRAVWQERGWLFGQPVEVGNWELFLVPLLAVPQLTHYVLDGFIWRRRSNPNLKLV